MDNNFKSHLAFLLALIIALSLISTACGQRPEKKPTESPDVTSIEDQLPSPVRDLVLSYLRSDHASVGAAYFASDEPDDPKEGDLRIDSLVYAGEKILYETIGVAYEIEYSMYWPTRENENAEEVYDWQKYTPAYVVLNRSGYNGSWDRVMGISYDISPDKKIEDTIIEIAYGIWDIDVSINFDGYPHYVGPGSTYIPLNEEASIEILKDFEPKYNDGDYWLRLNYKGLAALCYHNEEEDVNRISSLETVRTDVATHRGIRIGMSRAEVISAYPEIHDAQYWGFEGDYMWYSKSEEAFGTSLIFWFEEDAVTKIELANMFD